VLAGRLGDVGAAPPIAGTLVLHVPGSEVVRHADLALEDAQWLRDHMIGEKGLLPGVLGVEAMTHAARELEPGLDVSALENVAFLQPVKVRKDKVFALAIQARRGDVTDGVLACHAHISSGDGTRHHECTVLLGGAVTPRFSGRTLEGLDQGPSVEAIYKKFFHGESFQVVAAMNLGEQGARGESVAIAGMVGADIPVAYRARAMGRELALQTAGIHAVFNREILALPVGCDAIRTFAVPPLGTTFEAVVFFREETAEQLIYDVTLSADGELVEELEGVRFRKLQR
jgi:hypothetical protein